VSLPPEVADTTESKPGAAAPSDAAGGSRTPASGRSGRTGPSGLVSMVRRILQVEALPVLIATLILAIIVGVLRPRFFSLGNLHDVLQQSVYVGILAAGLAELLSGQRRPKRGAARLPGGRLVGRGLRRAIDSGIALVSGDRKRYGLMLDKPIWENVAQVRSVALAREGVFIRSGPLRRRAAELVDQLQVRTSSVEHQAGSLSGGNQQKLVFAKWLNAQPSVLLLDDPTRGVDVGAKAEMHALICEAAGGGAIVLLASTDVDELADVCHRVVVFFQGRVCAELTGDDLQSHAVLEAINTGATGSVAC
jgi:ABC-type branched-subunit amino acid transport system ATPase component